MEKKLPSGGWQANVEYFDDYVIKTLKSEDETRYEVYGYLDRRGKLDELGRVVERIRADWLTGKKIVEEGKIPFEMLGDLEFLEDGRIRQKRVGVLENVWNGLCDSGKIDEMRGIVDKSLDFIVELWKYGVHEKTFKVGYEFGWDGEKIILIDFGELCEDKGVAERQIAEKPWVSKLNKHCRKEVADYFNSRADEVLTVETLNKNWRRYC